MKAVLIAVDGSTSLVEPQSLEDLQALVGGLIQRLPHSPEVAAYINDEGKLEELPVNHMATFAFAQVLQRGDYVAGPCVLVGIDQVTGEDADAPELALALVDEDRRG